MKVWIVLRDKQVMARVTVPYSPEVVKQMKANGYKIKEVEQNV